MRHHFKTLGPSLALLCAVFLTGCEQSNPSGQSASNPSSDIERGRYLVERVSMCAVCHTPREQGEFVESKHLEGSVLDFRPKGEAPEGWMALAPRIAGLPSGWSEDDMAHFLETGEKPGGVKSKRPMPVYRYSPEDAQAAAAYLSSLGE